MSNEEGQEVQTMNVETGTVALITKAEIDQQITTAKKYPRSIKRFVDEATQMVTLHEAIAQQCIYALVRWDGKKQQNTVIEGPSARFAEIVASAWGNCRAGARVVNEGAEFITAQGVFHDLERNVAITFEVQRRITGSNGKRYSADMIGVTGNAASSIALRNAILKGVPKAFWEPMYAKARSVVAGDTQTLSAKRNDALRQFAHFGVTAEMILAKLGREGVQDVTIEDLVILFGLLTALKDGDTTAEQAFATETDPGITMPKAKSAAPSSDAGSNEEEKKPESKEKKPSNAKKDTESQAKQEQKSGTLSSGQISWLRTRLSDAGISETSVCQRFKIEKLEDISAADWDTQKADLLAMG